jgi:two-component system cell cycle sensor histidine kinase/response regulator CckA
MVYGVVSSHRGFIDVKSEVGRGTTFHLYFPVPPPGSKHLPFQEAVVRHIAGGTETILFAEDEATLAELAKALLEQNGYRVLLAKDGIEAVEVFQKHAKTIELVLLDLELPKLGGWSAFLKMQEIQPTIISVITSAFIDPESRADMLIHGVRDFIEKPYAPNQMLKKIRDALDSRKHPWNT